MRKKLTAIGNSLGVVIDKPMLELLNIDRETELDLRMEGNALILEPVRRRSKRLAKLMVAQDVVVRHVVR